MEVYFKEEYELTRDYIYDIEPEEFLEWLGNREPNEENLVKYIQTISPDHVSDDETMLNYGFENADDFLEECYDRQ